MEMVRRRRTRKLKNINNRVTKYKNLKGDYFQLHLHNFTTAKVICNV